MVHQSRQYYGPTGSTLEMSPVTTVAPTASYSFDSNSRYPSTDYHATYPGTGYDPEGDPRIPRTVDPRVQDEGYSSPRVTSEKDFGAYNSRYGSYGAARQAHPGYYIAADGRGEFYQCLVCILPQAYNSVGAEYPLTAIPTSR